MFLERKVVDSPQPGHWKNKFNERRSGKDRRIADDNILAGTEMRSHMERRHGMERRKHKRFKACDGAFVSLRGDYNKIGQIIDISRRGLSFKYIDSGEERNGSDKLDIFLKDNDFFMSDVKFETVSDIDEVNNFALSSIKIKRLSVQFVGLTYFQAVLLDDFFQNYTMELS